MPAVPRKKKNAAPIDGPLARYGFTRRAGPASAPRVEKSRVPAVDLTKEETTVPVAAVAEATRQKASVPVSVEKEATPIPVEVAPQEPSIPISVAEQAARPAKPALRKPVGKGIKKADFYNTSDWDKRFAQDVG
ncbi:hypothetical protein CONLIGDRAFT_638105 [Coniochaeta ligniaria NRRL 30616]|uniref:Uncharacterized protein n=1 Tax=Coniochaeta ligniaria NRRL 30616 TaxID=1408157 RepID=A0A1J7J142_9PEZI|nr:hypothetical protein CONLIGDRAFT_638105 [Coniochaeta ligniaria NRRL 30616]